MVKVIAFIIIVVGSALLGYNVGTKHPTAGDCLNAVLPK